MPETVLGDISSRCQLYLAAKPSHVGVDVDGLACFLHCPTTFYTQTWGLGFLSGVVLSHRCSGW
jgi:hypothetical protein